MMKEETLYAALDEIFQDVFDDTELHVSPTTFAEEIDGWDSLEHINLIILIENRFGFKFSMDEILDMKNVGEMASIIQTRATKD